MRESQGWCGAVFLFLTRILPDNVSFLSSKMSIDNIRMSLHSTEDAMTAVRKEKPVDDLDVSPRLRRKLAGHFGKVISHCMSSLFHHSSCSIIIPLP